MQTQTEKERDRDRERGEHDKQLQAKQIISIHRLSCAQAQTQCICMNVFA